ncbi:MAG: c-type cytochrome [Myxococcaceae bacterium]|nr:c-type cytochrome [Myxococcaceae bacterium]
MRQLACLLFAVAFAGCLKSRPAPDEKVEPTSTRIERGQYLVTSVFACVACHSQVDDGMFARPPKEGTTPGAGGQCWDESIGFPGRLCATNLTADDETGLGMYTDGELMRAMREGVDRHGRGLFPIMPYRDYAFVSDEDARAIVAYLRTLPPVKNAVAEKSLDFPVGIFIRLAPRPLDGPVAEPDRSNPVEYGRYLGHVCQRCHTPVDGRGRPLPGRALAGGQEFKLAGGGAVFSPNLTPHPDGLGSWSKEQFIARFRGYTAPAAVDPKRNTVMPWLAFGGMTDDDLGAIWEWLHAMPAIEGKVAPWR